MPSKRAGPQMTPAPSCALGKRHGIARVEVARPSVGAPPPCPLQVQREVWREAGGNNPVPSWLLQARGMRKAQTAGRTQHMRPAWPRCARFIFASDVQDFIGMKELKTERPTYSFARSHASRPSAWRGTLWHGGNGRTLLWNASCRRPSSSPTRSW